MASDTENPSIWIARIKKERGEIVAARLKKMEERKKRKGSRARGSTRDDLEALRVIDARDEDAGGEV